MDIDTDDARKLADMAMQMIDQGDYAEDRAATLLMHAGWLLLNGAFERAETPEAERARRLCRNEGVCPCEMVVVDRPPQRHPIFGAPLKLGDLKPTWVVAERIIRSVEAV